jgi:carbamoyl-phosphate synthase large subunit
VLGVNFAGEATRRMLGVGTPLTVNPLEMNYVGVKAPMFSFGRLVGADPMLGVEMMSTGEVGCIGDTIYDALLLAMTSTGFRVPRKGILLSLGPKAEKFSFADEALVIRDELKLPIHATSGTAEMLSDLGVPCHKVGKSEAEPESAVRLIEQGLVDLVINIPRTYDAHGRPDGYAIRRAAIDVGVPLITDPQLARTVVEMLHRTARKPPELRPMTEYAGASATGGAGTPYAVISGGRA